MTEERRAKLRANARRPRGKWAGTPEREALEAAKQTLREALPEGARLLARLICDPKTPDELRVMAFRVAADRAGLPTLAQHQVGLDVPGREVVIIQGGLGWPAPGGGPGLEISPLEAAERGILSAERAREIAEAPSVLPLPAAAKALPPARPVRALPAAGQRPTEAAQRPVEAAAVEPVTAEPTLPPAAANGLDGAFWGSTDEEEGPWWDRE